MVLDAIKGKTNYQTTGIKSREENKAIKADLNPETKKPTEMMIFKNKSDFTMATPKLTAFSKPIAENSQAAAGSEKPPFQIFNFNNEGRQVVATSSNPSGVVSALSSALSGAENNKGSGDKKESKGNVFLSAHKTLKDTRFEALGNDNCINIMKGLC